MKIEFTISLLILSIFFSTNLFGQKKKKVFIDTLDNAFDISYYMYNLNGLLPIISPITEPAVGYGASLATLYFIPKKENPNKKFQMPDIVAIAGGLTENNTWFIGGGYIGFWNNDRIRYRGVGGYGDIKLKYYGNGNDFLSKNPVKFSVSSGLFLQQAIFRLGKSRFMLGGKYLFSKSVISTFKDSDIPWLKKDFDITNSGLGLIIEYEKYDNILSPNKGIRINYSHTQFLEALGGDRDFGRSTIFLHYFIPIFPQFLISGFRVESQLSVGSPPFYMNPFIYLRGIPAMRYQGELTALIETEQLLMLSRRWGIVGFAGIGTTYDSLKEMNKTKQEIWNLGTGFRYLIARQLGLRMGIDIAKGPEDWGIYIIFGSAWLK